MLDSIYEIGLKHFKNNFAEKGYRATSSGNLRKWKKRARNYRHSILDKTGTMKNAFRARRNRARMLVTFYNNTPYFEYHQKGMGNNPRRIMMNENPKLYKQIYDHLVAKLRRIL